MLRMRVLLVLFLCFALVLVACQPKAPGAPSGQKVKLTVVMPSNVESFLPGEDENNNEIIRYLREKSGFDLNWVILPSDQPLEKLNLMMASNDPPDIVYWTASSFFGDMLKQEALADITDLVKQAENLQRLVPKDTWSAVTVNGKIYAVPIPQNQYIAGNSSTFARVDWLEELGIKNPVTLDDYYNMLKTIKEKKGVIPLTGVAGSGLMDGFTGAFGIGTPYKVKDGKLVYSYVQPEAKDYLTYMNKLYREGLLDQEWPVNKSVQVQEKLVAEKAAMTVTGWASALPIDRAFKEKNPTGKLAYIAPPTGPGGMGIMRHGPLRTYLMVHAKSKHIAEAVKFIDFMAIPEVYDYISFGEEGKHYEKKGDEYFLLPEYQNRRFQMYYVVVDTQHGFATRLRDKGFKVYSDQVVAYATLEPIHLFAPPIDEVVQTSAALNSVLQEYFVRIITGDLPLDKFDEYVAQWKAKGGDKAEAALNNWYQNEFLKR